MKRDSMYRSLESDGQTGNRLAKPPPEEPDALVAHVRVCEGPGRQRPGLLGVMRWMEALFLGCSLIVTGVSARAEFVEDEIKLSTFTTNAIGQGDRALALTTHSEYLAVAGQTTGEGWLYLVGAKGEAPAEASSPLPSNYGRIDELAAATSVFGDGTKDVNNEGVAAYIVSNGIIVTRVYTPGLGAGGLKMIDSSSGTTVCSSPDIVHSEENRYVVVWSRGVWRDSCEIRCSTYMSVVGNFTAPITLVDPGPGFAVMYPRLTRAWDGTVLLVYQKAAIQPSVPIDDWQWNIYAQRVAAARTLIGNPVLLSGSTTTPNTQPRVSYSYLSGKALVVWEKRHSVNDHDIFGCVIGKNDAGDLTANAPFGIATTVNKKEIMPSVAWDYQNDRHLVVWARQIAADIDYDIIGRLITPEGNLVFDELVFCDSTFMQDRPSVAMGMASDGPSFMCMWRDNRNVDYGLEHTEIWGRRYRMPNTQRYTLGVSILPLPGIGHVTVSPQPGLDGKYHQGEVVTFAAIADAGYRFRGWMISAVSVTNNPVQVIADANKDVNAVFEESGSVSYTVTFDEQSGTPPNPASKSVTYGSTYGTLATTTRTGYTFGGWWTGVGGTGVEVTSGTSVTLATPHTLYANWTTVLTYTLTISAQPFGGGTVLAIPSAASDGKYAAGTVITLSANAGSLYNFDSWGGDASGSTSTTQVTMNGDKGVVANFTLKPVPAFRTSIDHFQAVSFIGRTEPVDTVNCAFGDDESLSASFSFSLPADSADTYCVDVDGREFPISQGISGTSETWGLAYWRNWGLLDSVGTYGYKVVGHKAGYADAVGVHYFGYTQQSRPWLAYLGCDTWGLSPSTLQGYSPASDFIQIWNGGAGSLSYTVAGNSSWISVVPASGTSTGQHNRVEIRYSTSGLAEGVYTARVTVAAAGVSPHMFDVELNILRVPRPRTLEVSTNILVQTVEAGLNATSQYFTFRNAGDGSMNFMADDGDWFRTYPSHGYGAYESWTTVKVDYVSYYLPVGNYRSNIVVTADNAVGSPQTIAVLLNVVPPTTHPVLEVSPNCLSIVNADEGLTPPYDQYIEVYNAGDGRITFTASSDSAWLVPRTTTGSSTDLFDRVTIPVHYETATLIPGSYTGHVTFAATGASGSPMVMTAILNVIPRNRSPGHLNWSFAAGFRGGVWLGGHAIGPDGSLFVGGSGKRVYCVSASGQQRWEYAIPTGTPASTPVLSPDGTLYIGTHTSGGGGSLYALNSANGAFKWRCDTGAPLYATPALGVDGTVYVQEMILNAMRAITPQGALKWEFTVPDMAYGSPSLVLSTNGILYAGDGDSLYALKPANGSLAWTNRLGSGAATAIGMDGTVFVATGSGALFALDGNNGNIRWSVQVDGWNGREPVIGPRGVIIVGASNSRVFSFSPLGKTNWYSQIPKVAGYSYLTESVTPAAIGDDGLIYVGRGPDLCALNPDGSTVWVCHLPDYQLRDEYYHAPTIGTNGMVYSVGNLGSVCAVYCSSRGLAVSAWPTVSQNARNTGLARSEPVPEPPSLAVNPSPISGAIQISASPHLTWQNGGYATGYRLLLGLTAGLGAPQAQGERSDANRTWDPGRLDYGRKYYWRVDATNVYGSTPGDVWSFIVTNRHSLVVSTPFGMSRPPAGTNWYDDSATCSTMITNIPAASGGTQHVCQGWIGVGSVPSSGVTTNTGTFILTNDSRIEWLWNDKFWLDTGVAGSGTVSVLDSWQAAGADVVVTGAPAAHFHLAYWSGQTNDCIFRENVVSAPMSGPRAITATFALDQHSLTVLTLFGMGTPSVGTNWYNYNASVRAAITNSPVTVGAVQYLCCGWQGTGSVPSGGTTTNAGPFTITTNSAVTWLWRTNFWLDVDHTGSGKLNTNDCWLASSTNLQITATPSNHWSFTQWSGQTNGCTIVSNRITVVMNSPRFISADFAVDRHTLTIVTPYGQSWPPVGANWFDYGFSNRVAVTNSPVMCGGTQYACRGWSGTGSVPATGTTTNTGAFILTTNSTVTWLWKTNFWLDVGYTGLGKLSTNDCWLALGTNYVVTATASNHWHFGAWSGDTNGCTIASNKITVAMSAPRAVTASFNIDQHKLTVTTPYGGAWPLAGTNWFDYGSSNSVAVTNSPVIMGGTQYVCRGWTGTGSVSANGTNTNTTVFVLAANSAITWLWKTNFWLDCEVQGQGALSTGDVWIARGTNVQVTATKSNYWTFSKWTGNTNGCTASSNRITVVMNGARQVIGVFLADLATNNVPRWWLAQYGLTNFNPDAMRDVDRDGMLTWQEWVAGCNPADSNSVFRLMSAGASGQGNVIRWPSISNRVYGLTRSTNLVLGTNGFLVLPGATNMPATPTVNSYTDDVQGVGPYFYRINVRE